MRRSIAFFITLLFALPALAVRSPASDIPFATWKQYLEHEKGNLTDLFVDGRYMENRWVKYEEFDVDGSQFPPARVDIIPLQCRDKNLYPTHPQQFTKEYVLGLVAKYDNRRLPGSSDACAVSTTTKSYCIVAQRGVVAVMSDTYEDGCGNLYRGYWFLNYRIGGGPTKSEDNMGTLFSKGRTQYPKRNAMFAGEVEDGNTYAVDVKNFLFLSPLLPNDLKRIREAQGYAARAGFRKNGRIWVPKN